MLGDHFHLYSQYIVDTCRVVLPEHHNDHCMPCREGGRDVGREVKNKQQWYAHYTCTLTQHDIVKSVCTCMCMCVYVRDLTAR